MDLGLEGKAVLVAGSTRGIGRAIAEGFLAEGAMVTVTGREAAAVQTAASELSRQAPNRVSGFSDDLSSSAGCAAAVAAAFERWKRLDVVVANIGSGVGTRGWDAGDDEWARAIEQNLYAAIRLVRTAVPRLAASGGAVVMISSIAGIEVLDAPIPYTAAKAALVAATKALSRSLAPRGIRVNAVAPGNVLAAGGSWEERLHRDRSGVEQYIAREVPLGRFGRPEEIADVTMFLASQRATFITGTCVVADGGQTRGV